MELVIEYIQGNLAWTRRAVRKMKGQESVDRRTRQRR